MQKINPKLLDKYDYRKILETMPIITVDGIIMHNGKVLLLKRANKPLQGKYWTPGGRIYKGEKLKDAFLRKMKEELGVPIKIISFIGFYEDFYEDNNFNIDMVHTVSFVFLATTNTDKIKIDNQSTDYKWVDKIPKRLNLVFPFQNVIGG